MSRSLPRVYFTLKESDTQNSVNCEGCILSQSSPQEIVVIVPLAIGGERNFEIVSVPTSAGPEMTACTTTISQTSVIVNPSTEWLETCIGFGADHLPIKALPAPRSQQPLGSDDSDARIHELEAQMSNLIRSQQAPAVRAQSQAGPSMQFPFPARAPHGDSSESSGSEGEAAGGGRLAQMMQQGLSGILQPSGIPGQLGQGSSNSFQGIRVPGFGNLVMGSSPGFPPTEAAAPLNQPTAGQHPAATPQYQPGQFSQGAPPAPTQPPPAMTQDAMMQMLMMSQLTQQYAKARKKKKGQGSSSDSMSGGGERGNTAIDAIHRYSKLKSRRVKHPKKIARRFFKGLLKKHQVKPGDTFSFLQDWESLPIGRFRSMGRISYALCEIMERLQLGQPEIAYATAIQLYKAIHQMLLDGGSWKVAWALTLLEDPYKGAEWGGDEAELASIAGMMKARADLQERVASSVSQPAARGSGGKGYQGGQAQGQAQDQAGGAGEELVDPDVNGNRQRPFQRRKPAAKQQPG